MCTVVYTLLYNTALLLCYKLFHTAPLLLVCYKLFNTAHCYVTSYLTLLYNMLIQTFWTSGPRVLAGLPAYPPVPWMRHFCSESAVFIHRQARPLPPPPHHQYHPQHQPLLPPAPGEVRGNIKIIESCGEARVQLVHPSSGSRGLHPPRLQCRPQSSWRCVRSWEAL